jgi:hypothetical protein
LAPQIVCAHAEASVIAPDLLRALAHSQSLIEHDSGSKITLRQRHFSSIFLASRSKVRSYWSVNSDCALSSAEEHFLHTEGVAGSNPAARTIAFLTVKPA